MSPPQAAPFSTHSTSHSTISPNGLKVSPTPKFTRSRSACLRSPFHLRHIARSTDRILSYGEGNQLTAEQLAALKSEQSGEETLAALLAEVEVSFSNAADRIRVLATANLDTFRGVGRKQLPTSIGGAMIHVADHTQRHTGQVVTTSKVLKAMRR